MWWAANVEANEGKNSKCSESREKHLNEQFCTTRCFSLRYVIILLDEGTLREVTQQSRLCKHGETYQHLVQFLENKGKRLIAAMT